MLNERSAGNFSLVFSAQCNSLTKYHEVNDLVVQFNALCLSVLDDIAPIRARSMQQSNPSDWVSDETSTKKRM